MNAFILLRFLYCPLTLMFHSRKLNHRINKIHKHTLRIVYNNHQSTFEEFLKRNNSITIHEINLQKLVTEMFKVNNGLLVRLVSKNFHFVENHYNFRHQSVTKFQVNHIYTEQYDKQYVSYLGPKIWNSLRQEIKKHCNFGNQSLQVGFAESTYNVQVLYIFLILDIYFWFVCIQFLPNRDLRIQCELIYFGIC